jgi:ABC-type transport system substrate-binding protein
LPTTHLLMFNPQSKPMQLRELRRAIAYGLDRERILSEVVLRDEAMEHGRIVSGPFFTRSYANSVNVEPWPYDLSAALALTLASAQQLEGQIPELKMLAPPGVIEQAAAAEMILTWQRIGINVVLVEPTAEETTDWDILYQTVQLAEPIVDLWPQVSQQPTAELADLEHFPNWLKREFIELDRMSDWNLAVAQTQTLHRQLTSEAIFVPLWEVDEFLIYRKNIDGVPIEPMHCYDRIDRWTMDAYLPVWQPETEEDPTET